MFLVPLSSMNAQARPIRGQELQWPPKNGTTYFTLTPAPGTKPPSLKELCESSILIVDATVREILPVRVLVKSERLETDVVFVTNRALKGSAPPSQLLVVTQRGGVLGGYTEQPTQFSLMQPGQHYLLFLMDDKRPNIPAVTNVPRYWIVGEWVGNFLADKDNRIHLSKGAPANLTNRYENLAEDQVIAEVTELLKH
jgi:hypothetical protein